MLSLWNEIVKSMSLLEWIAAGTSFLCVYLTVRNNIWNWFWGFIGVVLYGWVFWEQKLFANTLLQILYFLPIQFYGWWVWLKGNPEKDDALPISIQSNRSRILSFLAMVVLTVVIYLFLRQTKDPQSLADSLTTAMSIVAQYLQVHKRFENWIIWIVVDLIYAFYLLPIQHLYVSMVLYILFTVLAIMGAVEWWRIFQKQKSRHSIEPAPPVPTHI